MERVSVLVVAVAVSGALAAGCSTSPAPSSRPQPTAPAVVRLTTLDGVTTALRCTGLSPFPEAEDRWAPEAVHCTLSDGHVADVVALIGHSAAARWRRAHRIDAASVVRVGRIVVLPRQEDLPAVRAALSLPTSLQGLWTTPGVSTEVGTTTLRLHARGGRMVRIAGDGERCRYDLRLRSLTTDGGAVLSGAAHSFSCGWSPWSGADLVLTLLQPGVAQFGSGAWAVTLRRR